MIIYRVSDDILYTLNSIEILGIIYLAIAVSKLRERLAWMEGTHRADHDERMK